MAIDREPVDRAKLAARMETLTERTPSLQGESVERYLERVVALAGGPGGRLDISQMPEEDARELWQLTEVTADENGLDWSDTPE
jgi:hypothetical protein